MIKFLQSLALLIGALMIPAAAYAQNVYGDVNSDLEVNIADVNYVIDVILHGTGSIESGDVNKDGEINIADVNTVINIILGIEESNEGGIVEPTEKELEISQLTSDEDTAPEVIYTETDSLEYDELAQEVLNLFAPVDSDEESAPMHRLMAESEDDLAEEAIRNNGTNIFANTGIIIEQQDWNSGLWGKTRYGGFETYYNTHVKNGKRCLLVVFYHKGGFPNAKTAYLKLGQVNSGKIVGKITIPTNKEYVFLDVQFDDYLGSHGCVNFFPLVINNSSKAREYINPIMVKTDPIVDDDWTDQYYGYEFGTINGVSVYYNTNYTNAGSGHYQCVELCRRYVKELNSNINKPLDSTWGDAIEWPDNREHDASDPGEYMVYANDGHMRVREGDLIVWDHRPCGHIGVVIKTTEKYISVAHQNGGTKRYALPIGTTMKIDENGVVKDIKPGTNESPIFASIQPINFLIRIHNEFEDVSAYERSMRASTTQLLFSNAVRTRKFTVTNTGMYPLTISSIQFYKGNSYSINESSCSINPGITREFEVTYNPTSSGDAEDHLIIRSNADDNPVWIIRLKAAHQPEPKYVDLGLPSGTLWATMNVGASCPEEFGDYYAWGETETKDYYYYDNYTDPGLTDISGTNYDVAHVKWGGNWCMPSEDDFNELISYCTWERSTRNGVAGFNVRGSNGNVIFMPDCGEYSPSYFGGTYYWSSSDYGVPGVAYYFTDYSIEKGYMSKGMSKWVGVCVRPVLKN